MAHSSLHARPAPRCAQAAESRVVESAAGVHECTYTLFFSGRYSLSLTVNGEHVPGSPLRIEACADAEEAAVLLASPQRGQPDTVAGSPGRLSAVTPPAAARRRSRVDKQARPPWGIQFMGGGVW